MTTETEIQIDPGIMECTRRVEALLAVAGDRPHATHRAVADALLTQWIGNDYTYKLLQAAVPSGDDSGTVLSAVISRLEEINGTRKGAGGNDYARTPKTLATALDAFAALVRLSA